jgi:mycofactocin system glycosyltransferase
VTLPVDEGIPEGWSLELDASVRRIDGDRVVLGGSPARLLRLTEAGARWLATIGGGAAVSSAPAHRRLARRLVDAGLAHPHPPRGTGPSPDDVTVVVPVRDMADGLAATLGTLGAVGEVIVVDDGSADVAAVRFVTGSATVLRNDASVGPGGARERGWRAATRPFVAFVDAEVELPAGWLAAMLPHFGDDTVGAVAPRVRAVATGNHRWLAAYERERSSLDMGPRAAAVRPGSVVSYVPTAAIVVRREALESVDGFDEQLRVGEDVDLVWRLHDAGWRIRYEPAVEASHPSRRSVGEWLRQRFTYGTSAAPLAERHGAAVAPLQVTPWTGATWVAALLGHPYAGAGITAGSAVALSRRLGAVQRPGLEAARLVASGTGWSARQVADALRRPWWPVALVLAIGSRRARPAVLAAVALPAVLDGRALPPGTAPVPFALLRLADDVAYGTGVWAGCLRRRSVRALLPAFAARRARAGSGRAVSC